MATEDILKKFGRYFLLDLIAQGGMAEIYRARMASTEGAGRLMVIKRIQAGYGSHNEFLQMFKSEIKVTMGFSHPNIVQLYDFGEEAGQPYIAMELVDGKNLRQVLNRVLEQKQTMPIELAASVMEQAAAGLFYAHSYKDKITGEPLNVVHRDISPQNILISFEGGVKVIDFGIAKATTNHEATRAGVIKGKPSYLSPEQISGETLDGRSDVFSLGAVFWELLVGKKLFQGENDLAVLRQIESCGTSVVPPSTLNPRVPKELDAIVMRALTKAREKRYSSAEEMQRALRRFLTTYAPDFSSSELSKRVKDLFKQEIVEDRKKIQRLNDEVERLLRLSDPTVATRTGPRMLNFDLEEEAVDPTTMGTVLTAQAKRPPRTGTKATPALEVTHTPAVTRSASGSGANSRGPARPTTVEPASSKFWTVVIVGAAAAAAAYVFVPQLQKGKTRPPNNDGQAEVAPPPTLPEVPTNGGDAAERKVALRINLFPAGAARVTVNGDLVNLENPVVQVRANTSIQIVGKKDGYRTITRDLTLSSAQLGAASDWTESLSFEPIQFGTLTIRTTPSAEAILTPIRVQDRGVASTAPGGEVIREKTPFESRQIPTGVYMLKLVNEVLGMEKSMQIKVLEGKALVIDTRLEIKD